MLYECDQCGACCKTLIVEADVQDVIREPRILEVQEGWGENGERRMSLAEMLLDDDKVVLLACCHPCGFLKENKCSIYDTRPGDCRRFEAGSPACQEARAEIGLSRLEPANAH